VHPLMKFSFILCVAADSSSNWLITLSGSQLIYQVFLSVMSIHNASFFLNRPSISNILLLIISPHQKSTHDIPTVCISQTQSSRAFVASDLESNTLVIRFVGQIVDKQKGILQ
jgi:hypothetical protein